MKKRKAPVVPELWLVPREPFRASCDMGLPSRGLGCCASAFFGRQKKHSRLLWNFQPRNSC